MNILDEVIKAPTEFKAPGNEILVPALNEGDFLEAPYIEEKTETPKNLQSTEVPKPEKVFDPDFTTDIVVETIDTLQHSLFLALNNRKQKNKRFKNRDEYLEAVKLSYLTDSELQTLENYTDKKILCEKLRTFQQIMGKVNDKLSFTPDEVQRLKKPILQLVKQHNFDIPPGLALVLVSMDILSNRVIDLIMD